MPNLSQPHERALSLLYSELERQAAETRHVFLGTAGTIASRSNAQGTQFWVRRYSDASGAGGAVELPALGFAREAIKSHGVFATLQTTGKVPAARRFQVSIPTAVPLAGTFIVTASRAVIEPAIERALEREVRETAAAIWPSIIWPSSASPPSAGSAAVIRRRFRRCSNCCTAPRCRSVQKPNNGAGSSYRAAKNSASRRSSIWTPALLSFVTTPALRKRSTEARTFDTVGDWPFPCASCRSVSCPNRGCCFAIALRTERSNASKDSSKAFQPPACRSSLTTSG